MISALTTGLPSGSTTRPVMLAAFAEAAAEIKNAKLKVKKRNVRRRGRITAVMVSSRASHALETGWPLAGGFLTRGVFRIQWRDRVGVTPTSPPARDG